MSAFQVNYQALRAVFPAAVTPDDIGRFIRKPIEVQDLVNHVKAELDHCRIKPFIKIIIAY